MKTDRLLAATFALAATAALAQPYPNKSVKLIVPYPPGGATDVIGRVMAQRLTTALGQQVVVDNRGGAGGNIGAEAVAKSTPDGYTLLMGALTSHSIMATLEKGTIRYDLGKDLVPVAVVGSVPLVWVVTPSLPVKTLQELVAYAKANPGKLTYASSAAAACSASSLREVSITFAPDADIVDAMALPIPLDAPVTSATLPSNEISMNADVSAMRHHQAVRAAGPIACNELRHGCRRGRVQRLLAKPNAV